MGAEPFAQFAGVLDCSGTTVWAFVHSEQQLNPDPISLLPVSSHISSEACY